MSSTPSFHRARKPDEKAQRRKAILEAAAELFDTEGLDGVSLNAVARKAGVAKSNVYRYFESREAIFLALLSHDFTECVEALEQALARLRSPADVSSVARVLAQSLVAAPRFCALETAVTTVLERNISDEQAVLHKRNVMRLAIRLGNAVRAALPSLPASAVGPMLRYVHASIAGLYPLAHPA